MQIWQPGQSDSSNRKNRRVLPRGIEPNHFHIIYTSLTDNTQVIRYRVAYKTQRDAYAELKRLGDAAEPNTEWGDDGRIRFETRMHGRTGLFWIEAEVAGCVRRACSPDRVAGGHLVGVIDILKLED
jgi:hypothetical protein